MLKHLSIKNYILINDLELEFKKGFTVITGETGAGKSILVGAMSLILGNRADTGALLEKDTKCVIEGSFSVKGYGLEDFLHNTNLIMRIMQCLEERSTSMESRVPLSMIHQ